MDLGIIIRTAVKNDKEAIFHLANQLSDSININNNTFSDNFDKIITDSNHCILVAELEEIVVGYLSAYKHYAVYANGFVAYVDEIVVNKTSRGTKLGTMLMYELEKICRSNNCVLISLATAGAQGFYEKLGYSSKAFYYKKYLFSLK